MPHSTSVRSSLAALLFVAALAPSPAAAQEVDNTTRAASRQLGYEGVEAFQAGDYAAASEKLERAYAALPVASLALWSARALEKNGKLVEASERYLRAIRTQDDAASDAEVQFNARAEASAEHKALLPRIPRLTVRVSGTQDRAVSVTINGAALAPSLIGTSLFVNPGRVTIEGKSGQRSARETRTLAEGQSSEVTLAFAAPASTPNPAAHPSQPAGAPVSAPPPHDADQAASDGSFQRIAGWGCVGLGSLGVLLGAGTGIAAMSKQDELGCDDGSCPSSVSDDELDSGNTLRTLSTAGFIGGGLLLATGVTLVLTAPSKSGAGVSAYLGAGAAGLKGRF